MDINKKQIDITENIASGELDHIIGVLQRMKQSGFDRLYWDSYDSAIYLYKSNQCKCEKIKEVVRGWI